MKNIFSGVVSLALLAVGLAGPAGAGEIAQIDQATVLERIEAGDPSLVILDVRTSEEFAEGHLPGAVNIPYTHLPARISEIPAASDKDLVVYCTIGKRAEIATARLKENGFTRLLHLQGDIVKWQENRRPVEK